MSPADSPLHTGHRARMRRRFFETGLSGFHPHEMLELILYCSIPKIDVNPLAHALLERFGSVSAVCAASEEELLSVSGVGKRTAELIRSFSALCSQYAENRSPRQRTIATAGDAVRYAQLLSGRGALHELIVLFENRSGILVTARRFPCRPKDPSVVRGILETALSVHGHSVIILFKGYGPLRLPNKIELDSMRSLIAALAAADVYTVDYILLSGEHVFSLRKANLLSDDARSFHGPGLPRWPAWERSLFPDPELSGWYRLNIPD